MSRVRNVFTVLLAADLAGLLLALVLSYALRAWAGGNLPQGDYLRLLPLLITFPLLYGMLGLYSAVLRPPHEELKLLSIGTGAGFAIIAVLLFFGQKGQDYSRLTLLMAWAQALFLVPLFRYGARRICSPKVWWGYPVLLFAPGDAAEEAVSAFARQRERGLVLCDVVDVAFVEKTRQEQAGPHCELQLDGGEAQAAMRNAKARHPSAQALILGGALPPEALQELVLLAGKHFRHVLVSLDTFWLQQVSLRVSTLACGRTLVLRQNLLDPLRMRAKRLLDLVLCVLGAGFLLVVIPLIALAIRLDSRGPVFFTQQRLGRNGRAIRVVKFRTMVHNASAVLEALFEQDSALRAEWVETQKLTHDPRLTRVGRFLRHTSLDELPQVFNVLKGEMSFVGPRPIVESEIERYGEGYELYTRVRPGITGLWQISGRNDLPYEKRVQLDTDYAYNWSIWLDIYIIIRTVPALLSGRGAY